MFKTKISLLSLLILLNLGFFPLHSASASELIIPPSLEIDGLSFNEPLIVQFENQNSSSLRLSSIEFITENPVLLTQEPEPQAVDLEPLQTLPSFEPLIIDESTESAQVIVENIKKAEAREALIKEEIKIISSLKPSSTPSTSPSPTPSATPIASVKPVSSQQLSNGGLNADKLFAMSNSHRQSKGLAPFEKEDRMCQLAVSRAPEIAQEIASGRMHSGLKSRNLPYWHSENIISMRSEEEAFRWWINDYIHKIQIEGDYKYSCVACFGNSCAQEFTNFIPKQ